MRVGRWGDDPGAVGRGAAGVCVVSMSLSVGDGIEKRDGDSAVIGRGGGTESVMGCAGGSIAAGDGFGVGGGAGTDVSGGVDLAGSRGIGGTDVEGGTVGGERAVGAEMEAGVGGVWIGPGIGVGSWPVGSIVDGRGSVGALGRTEDFGYGGATAATVLGVGCCVCVASDVGDGGETSAKFVAGRGVD